MYSRNLKAHPLHGKEAIMLMDLSLWVLESIYGRTDVCIVIDFLNLSLASQLLPRLTSTTLLSCYLSLSWRCDRIFRPRSQHIGRGFINGFQQKGNWFSQVGKTNRTELLCKKDVLLDGQTSPAKSSSRPVNFPSDWPLIKSLHRMLHSLGFHDHRARQLHQELPDKKLTGFK